VYHRVWAGDLMFGVVKLDLGIGVWCLRSTAVWGLEFWIRVIASADEGLNELVEGMGAGAERLRD